MSANESKLYTFKEREWVVTGWAEGQMETEREDDKGQKVIVMQPYYQLFVISPVSSYKSDNYSANGMKAEKLRCVSNAVWKDLKPLEVVNLYFDEKKRVSLAASTGVSVELNEVSFKAHCPNPLNPATRGGRASRRDPPANRGSLPTR